MNARTNRIGVSAPVLPWMAVPDSPGAGQCRSAFNRMLVDQARLQATGRSDPAERCAIALLGGAALLAVLQSIIAMNLLLRGWAEFERVVSMAVE